MNIVDLNTESRLLCDANTTSYTAADLLRRINAAYEQVVGWILNADGTWQWDDTNQSDQPRGKGTLVEGQEAYTFASDYLQIEAMDVLDLNNYYIRLKPIDHSELGGLSPDEYFGLESDGSPKKGFPQYYDLFTDDSFRLYPSPSATYCTLASGFRVWFKRKPAPFLETVPGTPDSLTKEPGFASPYHVVLSYMAAIPYCMTYKPSRVGFYEKKVMDLKDEIIKHYSRREREKRKKITFNSTPWRR